MNDLKEKDANIIALEMELSDFKKMFREASKSFEKHENQKKDMDTKIEDLERYVKKNDNVVERVKQLETKMTEMVSEVNFNEVNRIVNKNFKQIDEILDNIEKKVDAIKMNPNPDKEKGATVNGNTSPNKINDALKDNTTNSKSYESCLVCNDCGFVSQ